RATGRSPPGRRRRAAGPVPTSGPERPPRTATASPTSSSSAVRSAPAGSGAPGGGRRPTRASYGERSRTTVSWQAGWVTGQRIGASGGMV
ncbi:MAG TPA: hypothetical protein VF667_08395, partial [Pseudonocardia sp.]